MAGFEEKERKNRELREGKEEEKTKLPSSLMVIFASPTFVSAAMADPNLEGRDGGLTASHYHNVAFRWRSSAAIPLSLRFSTLLGDLTVLTAVRGEPMMHIRTRRPWHLWLYGDSCLTGCGEKTPNKFVGSICIPS